MSQTVVLPDLLNDGPSTQGRWMLVIFNNDTTGFDEVILALIEGTGCDIQEAAIEAWEAHTYGEAPVHFGTESVCIQAAEPLARIGVRTDVRPEWPD